MDLGQLLVEHARRTVARGHLLVWTLARADTHSEQVSIRANVRAQVSCEQLSGSRIIYIYIRDCFSNK